MKPIWKLVLVLAAGTASAVGAWYLLSYRPAHKKVAPDPGTDSGTPSTGTTSTPSSHTSGGSSSSSSSSSTLSTDPSTNVGKTAYAKVDGVKVLYADATTYKIAKKGEWIGTVIRAGKIGGTDFYNVVGDHYVATNLVTF